MHRVGAHHFYRLYSTIETRPSANACRGTLMVVKADSLPYKIVG